MPASLSVACAAPVPLPERALSQAEVEIGWARDRDALRDCRARHRLVIDFIDGQRAAR